MMRNIKLTVSYDGTHYKGFQIQKNGITIQEQLETALKRIEKCSIKITGAGRTDAGVHALGQVVNFHTASAIPIERYIPALNSNLPPDIRIITAEEASEGFHAQYSAIGKHYRYTLDCSPVPDVFTRLYSCHIPYSINLTKMKQGAAYLLGEHHFGAFCAAGSTVKSYVRLIEEISIEEKENRITLNFKGNGFLYNMVRIMVGTLLEVAKETIEPAWIEHILNSKDRTQAGPTAPAKGLCLVKVTY